MKVGNQIGKEVDTGTMEEGIRHTGVCDAGMIYPRNPTVNSIISHCA